MKKYVLIISQYYPNYHPLAGQETMFHALIRNGRKIHTIRKNVHLWERRAQEVKEGRAVISVRVWTGIPYRSPMAEIFQLESIEVERLYKIDGKYQVGGREISRAILAQNDGLSDQAFADWFLDDSEPNVSDFVIIHFTNFKYDQAHKFEHQDQDQAH